MSSTRFMKTSISLALSSTGYSPLHHVFGRGDDLRPSRFFKDIANAVLEPDLNEYRGFDLATSTLEEALVSVSWGPTFMLREDDRSFQGIYVGAGPYLAIRGFAEFDSELIDLMGASSDSYLPAATLGIRGGETDQLALAITGGYRARFPVFAQNGAEGRRNGMYVAANFHYLHGLRLDQLDANLLMETDAAGLVSTNPQAAPFTFEWQTSTTGRGMASDFGVTFVRNRWDFGAGVSGVGTGWCGARSAARVRPCEPPQRKQVGASQAAAHRRQESIRVAGQLHRRRRLSPGEVVPLHGGLARSRWRPCSRRPRVQAGCG